MCRMVTFSGTCIRCGAFYTVPQLNQSVSCLEAKNNGGFGDCHRGVNYDQHDPGLECGPCSAALGGGDGSSDELLVPVGAAVSPASSASSSRGSRSSGSSSKSGSSSSGRHGSSKYESGKRRRVR